MCTEPLDVAKEAYSMFIEANMGNSGLCPGTAELEGKVISMLCSLMHAPDTSGGRVLSGGTESNISALWMARNRSRKRKVILGGNAHFSIEKGCDLLCLEPVVIPVDGGYCMDVDKVRNALDDDVCIIVTTAGTTELGVVDPIKEISDICGDIPVHVDAAFGGFVLPFMDSAPLFDFRIDAVKTLVVDHHKMGMSSIPAGSLLVRDDEMFKHIQHRSPYLTRQVQEGVLGTRASSGIASAYAAMITLGKKGYRQIVSDCMQVTKYLMDGLYALGVEPVVKPMMNILSVKVKDAHRVYQELLKRGWIASVTRIPSLRFVIMPHVRIHHIDSLLAEMKDISRMGIL
jgi:tyrosine decarboxylase/aspartate 1-decarboxylase